MNRLYQQRKCILIGGGALAREVYEWAKYQISQNLFPEIRGYLSDDGPTSLTQDYDLTYLGGVDAYEPLTEESYLICISDSVSRKEINNKLSKKNINPISFIHETAIVASNAEVNPGSIIFPFAVISAKAKIGYHVIINSYVGIGHDTFIGDYSTLSSHVDITGNARLEEGVFMGSGARVLPGKIVGAWAKVGGGVVVYSRIKSKIVLLPHIPKKMML